MSWAILAGSSPVGALQDALRLFRLSPQRRVACSAVEPFYRRRLSASSSGATFVPSSSTSHLWPLMNDEHVLGCADTTLNVGSTLKTAFLKNGTRIVLFAGRLAREDLRMVVSNGLREPTTISTAIARSAFGARASSGGSRRRPSSGRAVRRFLAASNGLIFPR